MQETLITITIISGIFGLVGMIFLIIGIFFIINRKKKETNCTSKTYGKVIDIIRHKYMDRNSRGMYLYPVFEYNIGNLKFIKESAYGRTECKYTKGQNVEIYFNPNNYDEYYVAEETIPRTLGTIFICIGIVSIIISFFSAILILSYSFVM